MTSSGGSRFRCGRSWPWSPATSTTSWTRSGRRLIGSYGPLTEALRRRRLEESGGNQILGQLFGVALDERQLRAGPGVCPRHRRAGRSRRGLPGCGTQSASCPHRPSWTRPGLWLARIDLPAE